MWSLPQLQEAYASNGLTGRRGKERMHMHRDIEKRIMLSVPRPFRIAPYPTNHATSRRWTSVASNDSLQFGVGQEFRPETRPAANA